MLYYIQGFTPNELPEVATCIMDYAHKDHRGEVTYPGRIVGGAIRVERDEDGDHMITATRVQVETPESVNGSESVSV